MGSMLETLFATQSNLTASSYGIGIENLLEVLNT